MVPSIYHTWYYTTLLGQHRRECQFLGTRNLVYYLNKKRHRIESLAQLICFSVFYPTIFKSVLTSTYKDIHPTITFGFVVRTSADWLYSCMICTIFTFFTGHLYLQGVLGIPSLLTA